MADFLSMIPVIRRIVYLRRLFDWLEESLEASGNSTIEGYLELPLALIESLEKMGDEIASVSLLKYCGKLRDLNAKIRATKGENADAAAIRLHLDHLPSTKEQYRVVEKDCLKSFIAWLIIPALLVLIVVLRSCGTPPCGI
jgi:hypothetical protein